MTKYYLLFRAVPYLICAYSSMFQINDWLSVMLGPDCWNYSLDELNLKPKNNPKYGIVSITGQKYGPNVSLMEEPLAQSLRYAVSGVGVNILFLALIMIYLSFKVPPRDWRVPFALLVYDALTFVNATGLFNRNTAGHPRCLDDSVSIWECGEGLGAFAPIVAIDLFNFLFFLFFPIRKENKDKSL
mmetsp:Transcript_1818/g.2612  ORF Transcript_1818/g.2612 Transcript_1818/m.2612 type:complete len:186 (-) Transcript_1818:388-945(-)